MATLATILNTHLKQREGTGKRKDSKLLVEIILTPARQIAAAGAEDYKSPPAAVKICFAGQFYFGEEEALAWF